MVHVEVSTQDHLAWKMANVPRNIHVPSFKKHKLAQMDTHFTREESPMMEDSLTPW